MYMLPVVIGTTIFCYIHSFNRVAKLYLESEKTLSLKEFLMTMVPN